MSKSAIGKEVRSIGRHSSVYIVGQALSRAIGFFMIPIYTRYISPTNYGASDLIEILTGIVMITISMGAADTMSRFYYAEQEQAARNKVVSTFIIGCAFISMPVVLLFFLLASSGWVGNVLLEDLKYRWYLQIGIVTIWFSMLCDIGYSYLRMVYQAKLFVTLSIAQLLLNFALNIYFIVFLGWDIYGMLVANLVAQSTIGLLLPSVILARIGLRISLPLLVRLTRFGLPLVPMQICQLLGFAANRFFLRWLSSPDPVIALAQVGLFSLGHKFAVVVNRFVTVPFNSFWGPRRLELLCSGDENARGTVARICTYSTFVCTYFALSLCSVVEGVIQIIADPRYYGAHQVVPFVALTYIAVGLEPHFATGTLYRGKTVWLTWISLFSLAVALAWNYAWVPRFGLVGAATANVAAIAVREALIYSVSQRVYRIPFELGRIAQMLLTASALYVLCLYVSFPSPYLTVFGRFGVVAMFPVILLVTGFFRLEETRFLGDILRKGRGALLQAWNGQ